VRYAAMAVLLAEGLTATGSSRLLAAKDVNGSLSSPEGEVSGVGPVETVLALVKRRLEEL